MNELTPAARAMVEAHRNGKVLTRADRDRLKQGVLARAAALGAAGTTAGTAVGMSLAAKIGWVTLACAIIGGASSAWVGRGHPATPSTTVQHSSRPTQTEVVASQTSAETVTDRSSSLAHDTATRSTQPTPESRVPENSQSTDGAHTDATKKATKHPSPEAASAPASVAAPLDPGPELQMLRQAREDLQRGQPAVAFGRLSDYDREHGQGVLTQERQALKAIALCRWRPGSEAQARAAQFLRSSPQSPLASRVRSACEAPTSALR